MKAAPDTRPAPRTAAPGPGPVADWTEISLTSRCNQRCFFCYEENLERCADLPLEAVFELIRQTRGRSDKIVFSGKEVLLRPDLDRMVAYATEIGLRSVVFTNGQALHRRDRVERLVAAGCSAVTVSFHFPDAEAFARGARVNGRGFGLALQGLRNVRDHNREHPDRPLGISVETDLFALNAGRLQEMRQTLVQALGDEGWSLRLACLVPQPTYDIGLPAVVDSMEERRREVEDFVRTQPPGIPLGFVKVPLCLLPEGEEHRSLDVAYVHEGTRISFNHLQAGRIDVDRSTVTPDRDTADSLRRSPYRWICRTCAVLPLCRFERLSFVHAGFLPDRANRPVPYRPEGAPPATADGLGLPFRRRSAADVLAPLGAAPGALARVEAACRAAAAHPHPEERILQSLREAPAGAPALTDAWCEASPVVAVALDLQGTPLRLGLGAPGAACGEAGALVDYLWVHPLGPAGMPGEAWTACLERLAALSLPEVADWAPDPWFHAPTARRRREAWRHLGRLLWPGTGAVGPWRCRSVQSAPSAPVQATLDHPGGARADLRWLSGEGAAALDLSFGDLSTGTPAADAVGLMAWLLRQVAGQATRVPRIPEGAGAAAFHLRDGAWHRGPAPEGLGLMADEVAAGRLVLEAFGQDGAPLVALHVSRAIPGRPSYAQVGPLALSYGRGPLEGPALAWAGRVRQAMAALQGLALGADALPAWQRAISDLAGPSPGSPGDRWQLRWEAGAPDPQGRTPG